MIIGKPELVAGLSNRHDRGVGCHPTEGPIVRGSADETGDCGAVTVAVLRAVPGRDVVATRDQMRQQSVPGHAGIDHRHQLSAAAGKRPHRSKIEHVELVRGTAFDGFRGRAPV
ncbi:Uncharacterised protein [Mycobacteroides abscessus subsp. abscessus]|nr:Uncharacterised protein [Mycobacteroides abscessus subsp. abscessus]